MTKRARVWLTDFGLAKRVDDVQLSMTGAILGTPRYMSPEQACSVKMPVDHRTDIYSLGATLYEFATGKPLFDAESTHTALGRILSDEPVAPRVARPGLPRDLETIIVRCLSKDADNRYESANELVDDLRAFIEGRPINARRPSVVERLGRWLQKNQRMVTTGVIAAAIGATLLLGTRFALDEYRQSKLGQIQFDTTRDLSSPVVATILNDDGAHIVPSFTLPTQHPVEIPSGDYELCLQSDGELSDRYRFSVYPGRSNGTVKTHLADRGVWAPATISGEWDVWKRKDGIDIVVFDDDGVTLLDGATSERLWRCELNSDPLMQETIPGRNVTPSSKWGWRTRSMSYNDVCTRPAFVASFCDDFIGVNAPAEIDCNQDGEADLILVCQHQPMIIALSGRDGALLWRSFQEPDAKNPYDYGAIRGAPLFKDIDGDDVPDLIACYMTHSRSPEIYRCYLKAVSGRSGETLWEQSRNDEQGEIIKLAPLDPNLYPLSRKLPYPPYMSRWYAGASWIAFSHQFSRASYGGITSMSAHSESQTESDGQLVPYPLQFDPDSKGDSFILPVGDSLLRFETATGTLSSTSKLRGIPVRAPQWIDFDSDGNSELLVCTRNLPPATRSNVSVLDNPALRVELWDVKQAAAAWSRDIVANWEWLLPIEAVVSDCRQWPLIVDLDKDGNKEIILPAAEYGWWRALARRSRWPITDF